MLLDWKRLLIAAVLAPGCGGDDPISGDGDTSDSSDDASDGDASDDSSDDGETEPPATDGVEYLEPSLHLLRVSMALRGVRPSADELRRVADDPEALAEIVEEYLVDPRFGETVRELHNDALLVDIDIAFPELAPLDDVGARNLGTSVMQGPLRLVEYVVTNDLPYTEIVKADFTVADETTATVGGLTWDPGGPDLQVVAWDDRPAAGVLSDSAVFIRHRSAGSNYHRGRANAISKALLCHDFLAADVEVDGNIDLSDPDAVNEAVTQNPACVSCHQTLDPLASFLWGYPGNLNPNQIMEYPVTNLYNRQSEDNWENTTERPPAYFGEPAPGGLGDLGDLIADDPRFSLCAAKRFYSFFHQVPLEEVPLEPATQLQSTLVDSGFDAKAVIRELVLGDEFRVAYGSTDEAAEELVGLKMARPSQLARMVDDLVGFRWQTNLDSLGFINEGDVDLMRTNFLGFAVLAGGMDSFFVDQTSNTVNTTTSLFLRSFAAETASYAAEHDLLDAPEAARLLTEVDADTTEEEAVRAQLQALHLRLFAEDVATDDPSIDESWALWVAALEHSGDPVVAWKTTLTAMLQDLRIIFY